MTTKVTASVLANTTVGNAVYGLANSVPQIAIDSQGRIYSASNVLISIANTQISTRLSADQVANVYSNSIIGQISNTQIINIANTKIIGTINAAQISNVNSNVLTGNISNTQISNIHATQITGLITNAQLAFGIDSNKLTLIPASLELLNS